jgi:hypothetical protein
MVASSECEHSDAGGIEPLEASEEAVCQSEKSAMLVQMVGRCLSGSAMPRRSASISVGCRSGYAARTGRSRARQDGTSAPRADPRSAQTTPDQASAKPQVNVPGRVFGTHRVGDHLFQVMASWTRQQDRTGGVPNGRRTWTRLPRQRNRAVARSCEQLPCRSLALCDDANVRLPVGSIAPRPMSRRASPRARENCLPQIGTSGMPERASSPRV